MNNKTTELKVYQRIIYAKQLNGKLVCKECIKGNRIKSYFKRIQYRITRNPTRLTKKCSMCKEESIKITQIKKNKKILMKLAKLGEIKNQQPKEQELEIIKERKDKTKTNKMKSTIKKPTKENNRTTKKQEYKEINKFNQNRESIDIEWVEAMKEINEEIAKITHFPEIDANTIEEIMEYILEENNNIENILEPNNENMEIRIKPNTDAKDFTSEINRKEQERINEDNIIIKKETTTTEIEEKRSQPNKDNINKTKKTIKKEVIYIKLYPCMHEMEYTASTMWLTFCPICEKEIEHSNNILEL